MKFSPFLIVSFCALFLSSCNKKIENDELVEPTDKLFEEAEILMEKEKFKDAAKVYSKIYFQHPTSEDGAKAELGEAFALYQEEKYEEAIYVLDDYIHLHPVNMDTAHAYHMKALCYYMQIPNVYRDQGVTAKALRALEIVVKKYPETEYAKDAASKIILVNDHLAGKSMEIGRLYLKKENPVAAIPRFQEVIKEYETTDHTSEALYRLVEAHLMLGLRDEAIKYASVLGHNYPKTNWYKYTRRLLDIVYDKGKKKDNDGKE